MSQGAVEKALGKLVTDDAFRDRFFAEPAVASVTAGLALSRVELDALSHLSKQALVRFSRRLDDRIRRLPVEAAQRPPPTGGLDADDDRPLAGSRTESGTAQCARTPRAGDDMASLDALKKAGGADPAEDP
ncbi:MAG TPA: Os1348 family NHLP clan protein [Candidatus Methylomirabilis sp.]